MVFFFARWCSFVWVKATALNHVCGQCGYMFRAAFPSLLWRFCADWKRSWFNKCMLCMCYVVWFVAGSVQYQWCVALYDQTVHFHTYGLSIAYREEQHGLDRWRCSIAPAEWREQICGDRIGAHIHIAMAGVCELNGGTAGKREREQEGERDGVCYTRHANPMRSVCDKNWIKNKRNASKQNSIHIYSSLIIQVRRIYICIWWWWWWCWHWVFMFIYRVFLNKNIE